MEKRNCIVLNHLTTSRLGVKHFEKMAKFEVIPTNTFGRDLKRAKKRGLPLKSLYDIVDKLANDEPLPAPNRNHLLHGDYTGYWECHITPDWLLLYQKDTEIRIISLYRTGTHSDIFGKKKK